MAESICWMCAKACGGCSWSRSFLPVDGWTAKNGKLYYCKQSTDSYQVIKCPEFELESGHFYRNVDDEALLRLCMDVLTRSARDYHQARISLAELKKERQNEGTRRMIINRESTMKTIELFFRGGNIFADIVNIDAEYLFECLMKSIERGDKYDYRRRWEAHSL